MLAVMLGSNSMRIKLHTITLKKPIISRVLHLRINHRAWLKDALSKPMRKVK